MLKNRSLFSHGRVAPVALAIFLSSSLANAGNIENLAGELAKIRGEVEELQTQLDLEKEEHHNRMQALSSQITDLSVEQRRQNVSIEKMQQALQKYVDNATQVEDSGDALKPVLLTVIDQYTEFVKNSFPFKTDERLGEIKVIRDQVQNDVLEPKKAANRLWASIEDEIRLSKENGIYQQTIELNGEKVLADVAKLGSVLIYFKTRDDQVGIAKKQNQGGWAFVTLEDSDDKERINLLFESLKKQIRQGYFELPNPLKS